jgi:hypothetical protein
MTNAAIFMVDLLLQNIGASKKLADKNIAAMIAVQG